jgi:hypothetical protein
MAAGHADGASTDSKMAWGGVGTMLSGTTGSCIEKLRWRKVVRVKGLTTDRRAGASKAKPLSTKTNKPNKTRRTIG